jgi:hypothetical protein
LSGFVLGRLKLKVRPNVAFRPIADFQHHKTLHCTPAEAAGLVKSAMTISDIVGLIDARAEPLAIVMQGPRPTCPNVPRHFWLPRDRSRARLPSLEHKWGIAVASQADRISMSITPGSTSMAPRGIARKHQAAPCRISWR